MIRTKNGYSRTIPLNAIVLAGSFATVRDAALTRLEQLHTMLTLDEAVEIMTGKGHSLSKRIRRKAANLWCDISLAASAPCRKVIDVIDGRVMYPVLPPFNSWRVERQHPRGLEAGYNNFKEVRHNRVRILEEIIAEPGQVELVQDVASSRSNRVVA